MLVRTPQAELNDGTHVPVHRLSELTLAERVAMLFDHYGRALGDELRSLVASCRSSWSD